MTARENGYAMTDKAMINECPEGCAPQFFLRGGSPLHVKICCLCGRIDWDDIAEQVAAVEARVRAELAGQLRAKAQKIRDEAWTPSAGMALAAIVEDCADLAAGSSRDTTPEAS